MCRSRVCRARISLVPRCIGRRRRRSRLARVSTSPRELENIPVLCAKPFSLRVHSSDRHVDRHSVLNFTTFRNSLPLFLSFSLSVHVCALGQSFPAKFLESRILLHPRDRRRIGALPRHSHEEIKVQFRHGSSLCSASESAQRPRFNLLSRAAPRNLGNRAFGWVGLKKRRLTNIASARASEFRIWHSRSDT